jgi:hypothetical protein
MNTEQKIIDRQQLESSIKTNQINLDELNMKKAYLVSMLHEAKNQVIGFENYDESRPEYFKKIDAKNRVDELNKELSAINLDIEKITNIIDTDISRFRVIKLEASSVQLIEQQNDLKAAQNKYAEIEKLIAEQELIIESASGVTSTALELRKHRGVLLAEAATGIDNAKKIISIDADIAKAKKLDEDANTSKTIASEKARETIEGLRGMLENTKQSIAEKRYSVSIMYDDLLCQMAEEAAEKYRNAAYILADSIQSIVAIDSLIAKTGVRRNSGVRPGSFGTITIPALSGMSELKGLGIGAYFQLDTREKPLSENIAKVADSMTVQGIKSLENA